MKNIFTILFISLFFFANAQENEFIPITNSTEIVDKLDSYAKGLNSIKSDFVQIKHISVLEEDIISKGDFLFLKPSNIKWSYNDPIEYKISIIDGKFNVNNDGKISEFDMNSNKTFSEINNMIVSMVNGSILTNKTFNVKLYQSKLFYKAELQPTNKDFKRFIAEIHIFFDKKDFMVSKIKMLEASEDYTIITFNNRQINTDVKISDLSIKN